MEFVISIVPARIRIYGEKVNHIGYEYKIGANSHK